MKGLITLSLFLLIQACDAPQRTRNPYGSVSTSGTTTTDGGTSSVTDDSTTDTSDDGIEDSTSTTVIPGFEDCNLEYRYYANNIGYIGLCQNDNSENRFKLKIDRSDVQYGTCFVPVHAQLDSQGKRTSFKLGIAECVRNQKDKEYTMTLTKQRSEEINGVMVVKATAVNAYLQCMSAKVDFLSAYPGCQYDASCLQAANNYASSVCSQFVSTYPNDYKEIYPLD
ncbi:MAG: hypothetical protein VYA54_01460 [Bdellovibrionota bacterium]|nr:hypothetical protein [Bdellovibrionota bacterium]